MVDIALLTTRLHLSTRQISQEIGYSQTNVRYWLKQYGLKTVRTKNLYLDGSKICTKCLAEKPVDEFYMNSRKDSRHSYCKGCMNDATVARQRAFKAACVDYKGGKCQGCGYDRYIGAFDFHHLDPSQKDFAISKVKLHEFNDDIRRELDKCVLVCATCHREAHAGLLTF